MKKESRLNRQGLRPSAVGGKSGTEASDNSAAHGYDSCEHFQNCTNEWGYCGKHDVKCDNIPHGNDCNWHEDGVCKIPEIEYKFDFLKEHKNDSHG